MDTRWVWLVGAWFTSCALAAAYGDRYGKSPASLIIDMLWAVVFSASWPIVALIWCGLEVRRRLFGIQ